MTRATSRLTDSMRTARRLIARDAPSDVKSTPEAAGAALQQVCLRVCGNLSDSLGEDGCNALFARALARVEPLHPALGDLRQGNHDRIHFDLVATTVASHGVVPVTAAIEAMLAALVDILGRLIGDDMVTQLIDHEAPRGKGDRVPQS